MIFYSDPYLAKIYYIYQLIDYIYNKYRKNNRRISKEKNQNTENLSGKKQKIIRKYNIS